MCDSHAYTETSHLPENFLPDFLDLIIWGHEHECLIDPTYNPEQNFHVMQPGSSVATSLVQGEAIPKHVAILSVTGRDFKVEPIRLKTVRPFVMRDIVLSEEKEAMKLAKKAENKTEITRFLEKMVNNMIEDANREWEEAQEGEERDEDDKQPLPLVRLRVEFTPPEGGHFDCENPARFSNRFVGKVANIQDVISFHRRKAGSRKAAANGAVLPEESAIQSYALDSVQVEKVVREFLEAQTLTLLPQNSFGDAVSQFIEKDDKNAVHDFLEDNLTKQVEQLMAMDNVDEETIQQAMEEGKSNLERLFAEGHLTQTKRPRRKPRPEDWDSDLHGSWNDRPEAIIHSDLEDELDEFDDLPAQPVRNGRGRTTAAAKKSAPAKKAAPAKKPRGKKVVEESSEEEEDHVAMLDDDSGVDESQLFVQPAPRARGGRKAAPAKRAPARAATRQAPKQTQTQLQFSQPTAKSQVKPKVEEISDEISDDDDDAFEPAPSGRSTRSRG